MTNDPTAALIVGAGPRLGAAIARELAAQGRAVGLVGRTAAHVHELAATLAAAGLQTAAAAADIADPTSLTAAITELGNQLGDFDVAVHNVSTWRDAGALALTAPDLLADVAAGAASLMTIVGAVAPAMVARGHGTILATGSSAADHPTPGAPSLAVQKAALRVLVQGLAPELAAHGVHCATVTINGVLGEAGFDVSDIAPYYAALAAETSSPAAEWRTVLEFNGAKLG